MHEQSETIQDRQSKWRNVFGHGTANAGSALPNDRPYADVASAVAAAKQRSRTSSEPDDPYALQRFYERSYRTPVQEAPGPYTVGSPSALATGRKLTPSEISLLRQVGTQKGVDPGFLRALAVTENGPTVQSPEGPTKGLGVVSVPAPTFRDQADVAGNTTSNTLTRYRRAYGKEPVDQDKYTAEFMKYFSRGGPGYPGYAPLGAQNDPNNLNENHLRRLLEHYQPDTGIKSLKDLSPLILGPMR